MIFLFYLMFTCDILFEEVVSMLIEFRFKNYRSFRDEATLSMEATGLNSFKNSLIPLSSTVKLFCYLLLQFMVKMVVVKAT